MLRSVSLLQFHGRVALQRSSRLFSTCTCMAGQQPHKSKLWIDCDAGVDDAQGETLAIRSTGPAQTYVHLHDMHAAISMAVQGLIRCAGILLALSSASADLVGISTVHGNVVRAHLRPACPFSGASIVK